MDHYAFDSAVRVVPVADGEYKATISKDWAVGKNPHGGYMLSILMDALQQKMKPLGCPHPVCLHASYLSPARPSTAKVTVRILKAGRTFCNANAVLTQGDRACVAVMATYGTLPQPLPDHVIASLSVPGDTSSSAQAGNPRTRHLRVVPELAPLPALRDCEEFPAVVSFAKRMVRMVEPRPERETDALPVTEERGFFAFADERPIDLHSLFFKPPPSDTRRIRFAFRSRHAVGALHDVEGELCAEDGSLLAMMRQTASIVPWRTGKSRPGPASKL